MTKFFCGGSPIHRPEDIIPFLGSGEKHWRKGRSAYELSYSWMGAGGVPDKVREALESDGSFHEPALLKGHFERDTSIPGRGKASQTDLLALCEDRDGRFMLGVEGKVDETLGPLVSEWDSGTDNRRARLAGLVDLLGGDISQVSGLRYQLLHRTAAVLIEARDFELDRAVMLVHSFDPNHAWFEDFRSFSEWLGIPVSKPGILSSPLKRQSTILYIGWCADRPES